MLTIPEIQAAVTKVGKKYGIKSAYLFGSYAKNTANEKSDVDLYVDSGLRGLKFVGFVESIKESLNNKDIDVIDKEYVTPHSAIVNEIKNTGILLYAR